MMLLVSAYLLLFSLFRADWRWNIKKIIHKESALFGINIEPVLSHWSKYGLRRNANVDEKIVYSMANLKIVYWNTRFRPSPCLSNVEGGNWGGRGEEEIWVTVEDKWKGRRMEAERRRRKGVGITYRTNNQKTLLESRKHANDTPQAFATNS